MILGERNSSGLKVLNSKNPGSVDLPSTSRQLVTVRDVHLFIRCTHPPYA